MTQCSCRQAPSDVGEVLVEEVEHLGRCLSLVVVHPRQDESTLLIAEFVATVMCRKPAALLLFVQGGRTLSDNLGESEKEVQRQQKKKKSGIERHKERDACARA